MSERVNAPLETCRILFSRSELPLDSMRSQKAVELCAQRPGTRLLQLEPPSLAMSPPCSPQVQKLIGILQDLDQQRPTQLFLSPQMIWRLAHGNAVILCRQPDFGGIAGYDGGGWVARGKAEAWPRFADHRVDGMLGGLSVGLDFLCMRVPDEA